MKRLTQITAFLPVVILIILSSCSETQAPKPRGYFRIDLPEKEYTTFDTTFPYSFEYPVYTDLYIDNRPGAEPYWINIDYPRFRGRLHISYKPVDGNLLEYLEDSRMFVMKHIPKANAIDDSLIIDRERDVYGLFYEIEGPGTASPCQFFLTDSSSHFLRGALYFNFVPNNDSLSPVIDFIKQDIRHLIATFRWEE